MKSIAFKLSSGVGAFVCRTRPNFIADKLLNQLRIFLKYSDNTNFDFESNGERRVLEAVRAISPRCIFDVGANEGHWSLMARELFPEAEVHAFEIVPSTFDALLSNTSCDKRIISNPVGLSDIPGEVIVHCSKSSSTIATANKIEGMKYHETIYDDKIVCRVTTGADYCNINGVDSVDFLKIDVEGMDFKVLKGFEDLLGAVKIIQFEYGIFNIASRALLLDVFNLLEPRGFLIGKIYPKYVEFFDYHFSREDFGGHNYIAVKKEQHDLLAKLRLSSS